MIITIDGPAGAGKSTVAQALADELGYLYVDTGAMFRAVTYCALKQGIAPDQTEAIASLLPAIDMEFRPARDGFDVWVNGEQVTMQLREPQVTRAVSTFAQVPTVRRTLARLQRRIAQAGRVVLEGRDMGSAILPYADVKFFLIAAFQTRVMRRWRQLQESGATLSRQTVAADLARRDQADATRALAPLTVPRDAVIIDATHRSIRHVVRLMVAYCQRERIRD